MTRICTACGLQQPTRDYCPICEDERQFVPEGGQTWTTLEALQADHQNAWCEEAPGLHSLITRPKVGIGQRAFLILRPEGNILWDCLTLLDDATKARIDALGGLRHIAISHPHYYGTMADWSRAFGAPVHIHADDGEWVQEPFEGLNLWRGNTLAVGHGMTLIRCGGHFEGAQVLHAAPLNTLFSGDVLQVVMDRAHVSFMRSYPNLIPLNAPTVRRIADAVDPYGFDTIHGAFPGRTIRTDAKEAVRRSARRYISAISVPDGGAGGT